MDGEENPLSKREQEILTLVARGQTNQEIARDLVISPNTVKVHLRNIFAKLEVASRTEAIVKSAQAGWIQVPGLEEEEPEPAPPSYAPPALPTWQRVYFLVAAAVVLLGLILPGFLARLGESGAANDLSDAGLSRLGAPTLMETGRWRDLAPVSQPRARLALTTADGLLFALGGEDERGISSAVEVYDPQTNGWLPRQSKPTAASNVQAAQLEGLIYVPGGTTADAAASTQLELYDPLGDTWLAGAPLPQPLAGYALAELGGRLYSFGGWDGTQYVDTVLAYDPASDAWQERSPLPEALGFAAAAALEDRIVVVGGYDGSKEYADCRAYYPAEDRWEACASMILPRGGLGLAVDGTALYAIGGGWVRPVPFAERYDSLNDTWSSVPSPVQGQWRNLGVASLGSAIYAVGGWSGDYLDINQEFQGRFRAFLPFGARGQSGDGQ